MTDSVNNMRESVYNMTDPLHTHPVYRFIMTLLDHNSVFFWCSWVLGIVLTVLFFGYCLSKEGRDERGRAIAGTACIYGAVALLVLMNLLGQFSNTALENIWVFSNAIRLVYNGYFITVLAAIAILRKIR